MAINTNIEDTKNIIWREDRNLFAIASLLLLIIVKFRVLLEVVLIISVVIIV